MAHGIGTLDGDAIALQFWTGAISPWVHASTLIGNRPNLASSAMGRAYPAFCGEEERTAAIAAYRAHSKAGFTAEQEEEFQLLLAGVRKQGHALRSPQTEPHRNTTVAVPIRPGGKVMASVTVSFVTSAVPRNQMSERVIEPLKDMVRSIETVISFMRSGTPQSPVADARAGEQDFGL